MQILLTNDDGISSPGINLLAKALRDAGHRVFVIAPDINRSGSSNSIVFLYEPVKLTEIEKDTWSCSGTPVDCVITGLLGGIPQLDITEEAPSAPVLVLSGINIGANLGTDIIYSGTAAAARQGSLFGIPSIALSLVENNGEWHWQPVVSYITENLNEFIDIWKTGTFVNINFPNNNKKPSALVSAAPSMRYYDDRIIPYTAPNGDIYCFAKTVEIISTPDQGSDWTEVQKNNAAFSVIISQPVAMEDCKSSHWRHSYGK